MLPDEPETVFYDLPDWFMVRKCFRGMHSHMCPFKNPVALSYNENLLLAIDADTATTGAHIHSGGKTTWDGPMYGSGFATANPRETFGRLTSAQRLKSRRTT